MTKSMLDTTENKLDQATDTGSYAYIAPKGLSEKVIIELSQR